MPTACVLFQDHLYDILTVLLAFTYNMLMHPLFIVLEYCTPSPETSLRFGLAIQQRRLLPNSNGGAETHTHVPQSDSEFPHWTKRVEFVICQHIYYLASGGA